MNSHLKNLPSVIYVGQREFSVSTSTANQDPLLADAYGYTYHSGDKIVLDENLPIGRIRNTLIHELLHAIMIVNYNKETEPLKPKEGESDSDYNTRLEHFFIYNVTELLVQVIIDNPALIKFLQEGNRNGI